MPPRTNTHEHAADRRDATKSEPAASEPIAARRYHARLPGLECAENLVKKRFWFRVLSRGMRVGIASTKSRSLRCTAAGTILQRRWNDFAPIYKPLHIRTLRKFSAAGRSFSRFAPELVPLADSRTSPHQRTSTRKKIRPRADRGRMIVEHRIAAPGADRVPGIQCPPTGESPRSPCDPGYCPRRRCGSDWSDRYQVAGDRFPPPAAETRPIPGSWDRSGRPCRPDAR